MTIVPPKSSQDIQKIAYKLREALNMQSSSYFPIIKFLELILPNIDPEFNIRVESKENMVDTFAYYDCFNNEMVVREDVYNKVIMDDGRHRFTLAHELGHYMLHHQGIMMCKISDEQVIPKYIDPEWQADKFAAALLMPNHLIKNMTVDQISKSCKTSLQAAQIAYKQSQGL